MKWHLTCYFCLQTEAILRYLVPYWDILLQIANSMCLCFSHTVCLWVQILFKISTFFRADHCGHFGGYIVIFRLIERLLTLFAFWPCEALWAKFVAFQLFHLWVSIFKKKSRNFYSIFAKMAKIKIWSIFKIVFRVFY